MDKSKTKSAKWNYMKGRSETDKMHVTEMNMLRWKPKVKIRKEVNISEDLLK